MKMKFCGLWILLMIVGCASSSTMNIVKNNIVKLDLGDRVITAHRVSWYKEWTMLYDAYLVTSLDNKNLESLIPESQFKQLKDCKHFGLFWDYTLDAKLISRGEIEQQLTSEGVNFIYSDQFLTNLRLLPLTTSHPLDLYKGKMICINATEYTATINIVGFEKNTIRIKEAQ